MKESNVLAEKDAREEILVHVVDGLAEPLREVLLGLRLELGIELAGELVLQVGIEAVRGAVERAGIISYTRKGELAAHRSQRDALAFHRGHTQARRESAGDAPWAMWLAWGAGAQRKRSLAGLLPED